jgi:hypothetical protein
MENETSFSQVMEFLKLIKNGSVVTFRHRKFNYRGIVEDFNDETVFLAIINKFGHMAHTHRHVSNAKIIKVENPLMVQSTNQQPTSDCG